jgi:hypothetical protein
MGDCKAAQAVELIRALRHQLHEMTTQLAWVESHDVTGTNGRACAMRMEAAALRRDIQEAQFLIDRLQRRYLNGDERTQQRRAKAQAVRAEGSDPDDPVIVAALDMVRWELSLLLGFQRQEVTIASRCADASERADG